jgi:PHD/YefM family antitoxin component YafN of YafNO toxin-antitoxin module
MRRATRKRVREHDEAAGLLRSPANAKRLLESIRSVRRGKLIRKKLRPNEPT